MFFVLKLKEIRVNKGLLQKDIAEILGVKQAAVSKYEREELSLNQNQIVKLCLALDVTPDELLGWEEAYKKYTDYLSSLVEDKPEH